MNNTKMNRSIEYINNSYNMNVSDDLAKYVLSLKKLIIYISKILKISR